MLLPCLSSDCTRVNLRDSASLNPTKRRILVTHLGSKRWQWLTAYVGLPQRHVEATALTHVASHACVQFVLQPNFLQVYVMIFSEDTDVHNYIASVQYYTTVYLWHRVYRES